MGESSLSSSQRRLGIQVFVQVFPLYPSIFYQVPDLLPYSINKLGVRVVVAAPVRFWPRGRMGIQEAP